MKQRLKNLESITTALKPYLPQYLQDHGIDTSKNFQCLNPKHGDSTPSMTIAQVPEEAYCYGCGFTCDIFTAASVIEKKPSKGKDWVEHNLLYLASKYGISTELEDLTQEEVYEYKTYRAYELASRLVADPEFGDYSIVNKEIARRGWDKTRLEEWGIGTVNYDEFKDRMKKAGFAPGFLSSVDLDRSNLFDNSRLLFTVYDEEGRPVGFSAKNLNHRKDDKRSGPKYINTSSTGLECAIFKKGTRLYGLDIAKEAPSPLYIFEGQADVITARHNGLMNCVCTLGTAFTDHHINLLKKTSCLHLVFVFDGDDAGELAIQKVLDDKLAGEQNFRVKLIQLPNGVDPDDLIREKGIDELLRMKKWTAFEWRMMQFIEETKNLDEDAEINVREIAEKMIPIIVSEPSHIRQEEMARQVARMTGYDLSTILSEIKRLRNREDAEIQDRKKAAIEALLWDVQKNPDEAEIALVQCQSTIQDINKSIQDSDASKSVLSAVQSIKEFDEAKTGEFAGFHMKPYGLGGIGARLNDDWRQDNLVFIGASEQGGKTTLCSQMAYEIADDPKNEAVCIYHSIDDAMKFILYKLVCNAANDIRLKLGHVSNPNYWSSQEGLDQIPKLREKGYKKILSMIQDGSIIIKDSSDGNGIVYEESLVKYYREQYPNKNIVLFIDNFHKLPDYENIQGHERIKRMSNKLKNMCVENHVTIISTVEYRKLAVGEKPSNVAIAESRSLAYDASVIIHLYNEVHHKIADESILVHEHNGELLPRIWCKFGKNKVSGYEGREFLDLYPAAGTMRAVDLEQAIQEQKARMEFLNENKNTTF